MTVLLLQKRLISLGFDPGPPDGLMGPSTLRAVNMALDRLGGEVLPPPPPVLPKLAVVPIEWMPWAQMQRVIWHWTAGTNKAGAVDKQHYHIIIEGDGGLVRGDHAITANEAPAKANRANHTLNCNTGSIGVSLAGMKGAHESPFNPGPYPITEAQWRVLARVLADLTRRYGIPVTRSTVLSHAEVQGTLGIPQRQKWDIARLPFNLSLRGATEVGNEMRTMVQQEN